MPRNGAGTYTRSNGSFSGATTWAQTKAAGFPMTDNTLHDTHDQDIADALTATLDKGGEKAPSANLPMGTFRHTGTDSTITTTTPRTVYCPVDALTQSTVFRATMVRYGVNSAPFWPYLPFGDRLDYIEVKFTSPPITDFSQIADGFTFTYIVPETTSGLGTTGEYKIRVLHPDTQDILLEVNILNNSDLSSTWFPLSFIAGTTEMLTWNATQASFCEVMRG